jgi:hypothetical protein
VQVGKEERNRKKEEKQASSGFDATINLIIV